MKMIYLDYAIKTARKAGEFIIKRLGKVESISYKGRINLVTDVDKLSEEVIVKSLKKAFPEHSFLAEEIYTKETNSTFKWIIDPLDGTTNYAHGFPFFSVSIALQKEREIILGIVYDPTRNEMFTAIKSRGSYLNKKRIYVSKVTRLERAFLATGFSYNIKDAKENNIEHFTNFIYRAQAIRRAGSAALDLAYVACGRFDGFWELDLKPWDTAAGTLLVKEAGGRVSDFSGKPHPLYTSEVLASNRRIHKDMIKILKLGRASAKPKSRP